MPVVELQNGQQLIFPDDMSQKDISAHIMANFDEQGNPIPANKKLTGFMAPGMEKIFPQATNNARDLGGNILQGAANTAVPALQTISEKIPAKVFEATFPQTAPQVNKFIQQAAPNQVPFPQVQGQPGSGIGGFLGTLPFAAIPGAGEADLGLLAANVPRGLGMLSRLGVRGAEGAAQGALVSPQDPLRGAAYGAGIGSGASAFARPISSLSGPLGRQLVKMFPGIGKGEQGQITAEEFQKNLASQPEGVKLPLGNVANSPAATSLNVLLAGVPFSGAAVPEEQAAQVLQSKLNKILSYHPEEDINPDQMAYDETAKAYEAQKNNTSNAYQQLANATAGKNLNVSPEKTLDNLNNQISELSGKADTPTYANALNTLRNFKDKLSDLTKKDPITNSQSLPSYQQMLNLREEANSSIRNNLGFQQGAPVLRQAMHDFMNSLDSDIQSSVDKVGDTDIQNLANEARRQRTLQAINFERNPDNSATPFHQLHNTFSVQEPDTKGFIKKYIKKSIPGSDSTVMTEKLLGPLSTDVRNAIGASYVNTGKGLGGKVTKISELSPRQQELMFGENSGEAQNINRLSQLFPQAKNPNFAPKTGYLGEKIQQASDIAKSGGATAAALAVVPSVIARLSAAGLRSDAIKNLYLRGLLNSPVLGLPGVLNETLLRSSGLGLLGAYNNQ